MDAFFLSTNPLNAQGDMGNVYSGLGDRSNRGALDNGLRERLYRMYSEGSLEYSDLVREIKGGSR